MCPMRFILVFFSLLVAAYLACKALWFDAHQRPVLSQDASDAADIEEKEGVFKRGYTKIISGIWTLVDMASGRYLWRTVASQESGTKAKAL